GAWGGGWGTTPAEAGRGGPKVTVNGEGRTAKDERGALRRSSLVPRRSSLVPRRSLRRADPAPEVAERRALAVHQDAHAVDAGRERDHPHERGDEDREGEEHLPRRHVGGRHPHHHQDRRREREE